LLIAAVLSIATACSGARIPAPPPAQHIANADELITEYYRRVNTEDLPGVMSLMVGSPVLIEPFTRRDMATEHQGYESVAHFFDGSFRSRDDQVVPEYVRLSGERATVGWSLHGADGAGFSGVSQLEIRGGQIASIVIQLRE
jgi:hypothetical protein